MSNLEQVTARVSKYVPDFIYNAKYLNDIFRVVILESYYMCRYIEEITKELNISSSIMYIDKWEQFAGLNNKQLQIDERRDSVIKKFSSQVHANYYNFLQMLKTYDETTELREIIDEYRIEIKTKNYVNYDDFLNYLNIINNYKPAHIGVHVEVNRDYIMGCYMSNIAINNKIMIANTSINAPKQVDVKQLSTNIVLLQSKNINIKIKTQNSKNYYINNRLVCIVQKFKTLSL